MTRHNRLLNAAECKTSVEQRQQEVEWVGRRLNKECTSVLQTTEHNARLYTLHR